MKAAYVLPIIAGLAIAAEVEFDDFAPHPDNSMRTFASVPSPVQIGKIPIPGFSKAFRLIVHVTDKSKDANPSYEGHMIIPNPRGKYKPFRPATVGFDPTINEYHTKKNPLRLRGTQQDATFGKGSISSQASYVSNHGFDLPMSFEDAQDPTMPWLRNTTIGFDNEKNYVHLTSLTSLVSEAVAEDKFLVCQFPNQPISLTTLDTKKHKEIPAGCTPVRLFPECLKLDQPRYPEAFETAPKVRCYQAGADYSLFDKLH